MHGIPIANTRQQKEVKIWLVPIKYDAVSVKLFARCAALFVEARQIASDTTQLAGLAHTSTIQVHVGTFDETGWRLKLKKRRKEKILVLCTSQGNTEGTCLIFC
jgi:hypothetical protein